jgi:anaerobic magnesium-protoporphyrin IX monomethyl ester cyclase
MDQEIRKDLSTSGSGYYGIKAAVIVPPVCDFYFTPHRFSSLGAYVVCNILAEIEIPHVFFNFPLMKKKSQIIDIPEDIRYLKDYLNQNEFGKLSYFTDFQRFGPFSKDCARLVADSSPTICFISCFAFSYAKEAIDLSGDIKTLLPDVPIVIGGAGVSAYPLYFIKDTNIDFALAGEAEISLKLFCKAFFKNTLDIEKIPNLFRKEASFCRKSDIRVTSNDEIMPVIEKVHEKKDFVYYSISLTRGCDKNCRFCSNFLSHGHGFRIASFKSVALVIERLSIDWKSKILMNFEDDNLLFAPECLLNVMKLFREKFNNVVFLAENGIDYNLLTPTIADDLIKAGMQKFNFTLGSISENILKAQEREGSLAHFESIVRHIASKKIPVLSYFICGIKGDSKESVADVLGFLYSLPTQIGISMFYAVPGLPDFTDLKMFDEFRPCLCNGSSAYPWYGKKGLTTKELITAFRLSRYINLLKNEVKSGIELRLIEKIKTEKKLFTLIKKQGKLELIPAPHVDDELVAMVLEKITP